MTAAHAACVTRTNAAMTLIALAAVLLAGTPCRLAAQDSPVADSATSNPQDSVEPARPVLWQRPPAVDPALAAKRISDSLYGVGPYWDSVNAVKKGLKAEREKRERAAARARAAELAREKELARQSQIRARWPTDAHRILAGEMWIGMTAEMLLASRGKPREINRTISATGTREQWIYGEFCKPCAYVENGLVTTIQD